MSKGSSRPSKICGFDSEYPESADALVIAHSREVVAPRHDGFGRRPQKGANFHGVSGPEIDVAADADANAERLLGGFGILIFHARKANDGACALRRLTVETLDEAFDVVGAMPFEHGRGHDSRAHFRREETGAHAKEDAREKKGQQMRPGEDAKRESRDEEAQVSASSGSRGRAK